MKRLAAGVLALLLLLAAALLANTWRQGSQQRPVEPLPPLALDADGAAASLAAAVRARTVSGLLDPAAAGAAFEALHAHLRMRYPLLHERLALERFGAHTLVYTWPGRDPAAAPVALMAHQDVVPVAPGTETLWRQPPFDGRIADGFVWGRGTWDNKGNLVAQMEAVETLLREGFVPERTLLLIYGDDEEVGGRAGAQQVAAALQQRGVRLQALLDEGLVVTEGILPGIAAPVALVGVAEKGFLSLRLRARAAPGHASMPPPPGDSAVAMLSAALARLDAAPMPGGLSGVAGQMFGVLAPEFAGFQRVALSNLWLFGPLVERLLARGPSTNALLRTTTALTVLRAGDRDNVLPGEAEAVVNLRLLPGDSVAEVTARVTQRLDDARIEVTALPTPSEASRVSSSRSPFFGHVEQAVREVFGGSLVAPGLMLAATDARHFEAVADDVYRFTPVRAGAADLQRFHGTDERLSVANLAEMIRFYHRLLRLAAA